MTEKIDAPYKYYYWGPFLYHGKIAPGECQMLLKEGKKCRKKSNDHRGNLAGHLADEYRLNDNVGIMKWFKKYLDHYLAGYKHWRGEGFKPWHTKEYKPMTHLRVGIFWINYMKSNDFNPPHDHSGDLSFVIYPNVPNEINKENKKYKGTGQGPGGIQWFYGEGGQQYIDVVSMMPQTGDLFIFPANLKHWVFPFRSKVERVSVSGNIAFGDKGDHV